jgi:hypothetical protein
MTNKLCTSPVHITWPPIRNFLTYCIDEWQPQTIFKLVMALSCFCTIVCTSGWIKTAAKNVIMEGGVYKMRDLSMKVIGHEVWWANVLYNLKTRANQEHIILMDIIVSRTDWIQKKHTHTMDIVDKKDTRECCFRYKWCHFLGNVDLLIVLTVDCISIHQN